MTAPSETAPAKTASTETGPIPKAIGTINFGPLPGETDDAYIRRTNAEVKALKSPHDQKVRARMKLTMRRRMEILRVMLEEAGPKGAEQILDSIIDAHKSSENFRAAKSAIIKERNAQATRALKAMGIDTRPAVAVNVKIKIKEPTDAEVIERMGLNHRQEPFYHDRDKRSSYLRKKNYVESMLRNKFYARYAHYLLTDEMGISKAMTTTSASTSASTPAPAPRMQILLRSLARAERRIAELSNVDTKRFVAMSPRKKKAMNKKAAQAAADKHFSDYLGEGGSEGCDIQSILFG